MQRRLPFLIRTDLSRELCQMLRTFARRAHLTDVSQCFFKLATRHRVVELLLLDRFQCLASLERISHMFIENLFGAVQVAAAGFAAGEHDVELFAKLRWRLLDCFQCAFHRTACDRSREFLELVGPLVVVAHQFCLFLLEGCNAAADNLVELGPQRLESGDSYEYPLSTGIGAIVRSEERRVGKECRSRW